MASGARIGFSTPRAFNPISWLVRKFSGSKCSHTWFVFYDPIFDQEMVMEASEIGFRLIPFSRFEKENIVVAIITPLVPLDAGLKWAGEWLGTSYDYSGLIGMAWVILGRVLKKKWRNPLQNSKAMYCSEIGVGILQHSDYPGGTALPSEETSPEDLRVFCSGGR